MVPAYTVGGKGPLLKYGPTIYPHLPKIQISANKMFHTWSVWDMTCVIFWLFEMTKWE